MNEIPTTESPASPNTSTSPTDQFARHGPMNADRRTIEKIDAEMRLDDPELEMAHKRTEHESDLNDTDAEIESEVGDSPSVPQEDVDTMDPEHEALHFPDHQDPYTLESGQQSDEFPTTSHDRDDGDAVGLDGSYE